jgi:hypothetical protein
LRYPVLLELWDLAHVVLGDGLELFAAGDFVVVQVLASFYLRLVAAARVVADFSNQLKLEAVNRVARLPIVRSKFYHDRVAWGERTRVYYELGVQSLHAEAEIASHLAIALVVSWLKEICKWVSINLNFLLVTFYLCYASAIAQLGLQRII